jgi:hypothetical protein
MKLTKKQSAEYMKSALEILRSFGFQQDETSGHEYSADTIAGKLHVTIYPDWTACRFDDVKKAVEVTQGDRINPHSGKWNWMELTDLPYFQAELRRLIANPVANPELLAIPKKFDS